MSEATSTESAGDDQLAGAEPPASAQQVARTISQTQRLPSLLEPALRKRIFDCTVTLLAAPLWMPVLAICAVLIFILEGRPIFYISRRQIGIGVVRPVLKFRTMQRNADKLLNRDTVPVLTTAFLNIPRNSAVYTPIGRVIERLALTELPQLLHVLSGSMSLIGSRPLPARVMDLLRSTNPESDFRFLTRAGLTGPVQLIGRDALSDDDRLALEIEYCRIAAGNGYRMRLDLWLLLCTVFFVLAPRRLLTVSQVRNKMHRLAKAGPWGRRMIVMAAVSWSVGGSDIASTLVVSLVDTCC